MQKNVIFREYSDKDGPILAKILDLNGMYDFPEIEGPEAMRRVADCKAAIFIVCEVDSEARGFIKAIYDGSRALIHQLSIHPDWQGAGLGKKLIESAISECKHRGAPSISVLVNDKSMSYWKKRGFEDAGATLLLKTIV